jgi:hypothetical protein
MVRVVYGKGGLYCDVVGWGRRHEHGAASINSLIPCHVERRDARIIASRSRNIPMQPMGTKPQQGILPMQLVLTFLALCVTVRFTSSGSTSS